MKRRGGSAKSWGDAVDHDGRRSPASSIREKIPLSFF